MAVIFSRQKTNKITHDTLSLAKANPSAPPVFRKPPSPLAAEGPREHAGIATWDNISLSDTLALEAGGPKFIFLGPAPYPYDFRALVWAIWAAVTAPVPPQKCGLLF